MASYKELQDQIAELQQKAEAARAKELDGAIAEIRKLMQDFDISIDDLAGKTRKKPASSSKVAFRDTDGNTWSGRGRMPRWLQGQDKEQFRV